MLIIRNPSTDPYYNLAAEQYFLDSELNNILMLWRNSPAVIIGRNQNAHAEINEAYVREHKIAVVRRLTGGGAVFHDLGNINYTFIIPEEKGGALDFKRFCEPVIAVLRRLGARAEMSGRNDIIIDGKKVSGSAQCVRNGKIMHHGTLLYSADLSYIAGALNVNSGKLNSKGIKSVSSRVANITDFITTDMDVTAFMDYMENSFEGERTDINDNMRRDIQALADSVYSTWEWNYGLSKEYSKHVSRRYDYGTVDISLNVNAGLIEDIKISGDFFGRASVSLLEAKLRGCRYEYDAVVSLLRETDPGDYIMGAGTEEISELIFSANNNP
jgi:lipoate-protein ligase A